MTDRAIVFVDGNNWYHGLKSLGLTDLGQINYAKVSEKLIGPRDWIGTRYYVGQVRQTDNTKLYADQRRFLSQLRAMDRRISVHLGRLEQHSVDNVAAKELLSYLAALPIRLPPAVYRDLIALGKKHRSATVFVEKAVDVHLAVDLVSMAQRDEYDAAYILSADGDYTPAVEQARALGKKVYAASAKSGAQLAAAVNSFIRVDGMWVDACR
jgi:uncharacterized LabA/DUF88 family protein